MIIVLPLPALLRGTPATLRPHRPEKSVGFLRAHPSDSLAEGAAAPLHTPSTETTELREGRKSHLVETILVALPRFDGEG